MDSFMKIVFSALVVVLIADYVTATYNRYNRRVVNCNYPCSYGKCKTGYTCLNRCCVKKPNPPCDVYDGMCTSYGKCNSGYTCNKEYCCKDKPKCKDGNMPNGKCYYDKDCATGYECMDRYCCSKPPCDKHDGYCSYSNDCKSGYTCKQGYCCKDKTCSYVCSY